MSSKDIQPSSTMDKARVVFKICIVIGMLLAGIGISVFTYVQAYPKANLVVVPKSEIHILQISTWLIICGLVLIFVFGGASQISACMKRRSKAAAAASAASRKKESGIGTGLDESTTVAPSSEGETTEERGQYQRQRRAIVEGDDIERGEPHSDDGGRVFDEGDDEVLPLLGGVEVPKFSNKSKSLKISFT